jgi:flagellar protein FliJ
VAPRRAGRRRRLARRCLNPDSADPTRVHPLKSCAERTINPFVDHPSFKFRLERVRSLRERTEERAREDLARELSHRLRGEAMLHEATLVASSAREAGLGALRPGASGADLLAAQAWIERSERARREAALELDRRDAEVAARRETLTEAARDREVIERLKRRRRADHDREVARLDQIALDEVALGVHRRGAAAA